MDTHVEAFAQNVSLWGVFVISQRAAPVGTEVEVTLLLPNGLQSSTTGKVVRVAPEFTGDGRIEMGIECNRPFSEPIRVAETRV